MKEEIRSIFTEAAKLKGVDGDEAAVIFPEEGKLASRLVWTLQQDPEAFDSLIAGLRPKRSAGVIAATVSAFSTLMLLSPELLQEKPPYQLGKAKNLDIRDSLLDLLSHRLPTIRLRAATALGLMVVAPNPYTKIGSLISLVAINRIREAVRKSFATETDDRVRYALSRTYSILGANKEKLR